MFMRMSPEGVHVPHAAHHDGSMGNYRMMLYLNREPDCQGGTELLSYLTTGDAAGNEENAEQVKHKLLQHYS